MRMTSALSLIVLLCVAAAPSTKPTCPPMCWKAKAGAPEWVHQHLARAQETREKIVEKTPAIIQEKEAFVAQVRANPSHPRRKFLKSYEVSLDASRKSLAAATQPYVIPESSQKDGVKLKDWVEPISQGGTAQ